MRKNISKNELQNHLNSRLHQLIGNNEISFGEPILLAAVDSEGGNWSKSIVMRGNKHDVERYEHVIRSILKSISEEFNLE